MSNISVSYHRKFTPNSGGTKSWSSWTGLKQILEKHFALQRFETLLGVDVSESGIVASFMTDSEKIKASPPVIKKSKKTKSKPSVSKKPKKSKKKT